MATVDTTQTTSPKPLLIRGDRLLLALDMMEYIVHFCRYDCPKIAQRAAIELHDSASTNPRRCSREQALTVLGRCGFTPRPCPRASHHDNYCIIDYCDVPIRFKDGAPGMLQSFLRDQRNAGLLDEQCFAIADWVIEHTAYIVDLEDAVVRSLFRLIASGELTEADFKE